jgi:hypothetical protein
MEQFLVQVFFKAVDSFADRRLPHAKILRGGGNAAAFDNPHEDAHASEKIHSNASVSLRSSAWNLACLPI